MVGTMSRAVTAAAATLVLTAAAWAAADANGKWTWTRRLQNQDVQTTLELKQDSEKLTGSIAVNGSKLDIRKGAIKGNELSFYVERELNGRKTRVTYKGTLAGDTIKGTTMFDREGLSRTRDWTADRVK